AGSSSRHKTVVSDFVFVLSFFFFKQKTAYVIVRWLEFRRVLFLSCQSSLVIAATDEDWHEVDVDADAEGETEEAQREPAKARVEIGRASCREREQDEVGDRK